LMVTSSRASEPSSPVELRASVKPSSNVCVLAEQR
jgi:hypothetical protein